jgi:hypothetical protein
MEGNFCGKFSFLLGGIRILYFGGGDKILKRGKLYETDRILWENP